MALIEFKCPNCGRSLQFDAEKQEMTCRYCKSVISVQALKEMDEVLAQEPEWTYEGGNWREGEQQGMVLYSCKSCGGEIAGDETLGSTSCPFCGNQVVIISKFAGALRPDLIILTSKPAVPGFR